MGRERHMSYSLEDKLVIGVSARTLFDLTKENEIFEREGKAGYLAWQIDHEKELLKPGPGFGLVRALLGLNECPGNEGRVEVILMSHNSPDVSLRLFHSVSSYGLSITRAVMVSGSSLVPYLGAFHTDLFLSACEEDVQCAIEHGFAAGIICTREESNVIYPTWNDSRIRIAFDGDAVLFDDGAEQIFREKGLAAFEENEQLCATVPLSAGPFARFLKKLSDIRKQCPQAEQKIRTALVTSRCAPAHERVIRTLRSWDVQIDEAFFLGGIEKKEILKAFGAQIFFDDQQVHTRSAASVVPTARVPYVSRRA